MTSRSEMKRKNVLQGNPMDEGVYVKSIDELVDDIWGRPKHEIKKLIEADRAEIQANHDESDALNERFAKKVVAAGFDHPCKGTCSGWQQGYDSGRAAAVILPEYAVAETVDYRERFKCVGFNDCIDEVKRLNGLGESEK